MDEKITALDKQIKQLQEKKSKLIKEKKEKEERRKREIAIKVFNILESIGIDTVEKTETLKLFLQSNEEFKLMLVDFNVKKIGGSTNVD